jgi:hypothetical protein
VWYTAVKWNSSYLIFLSSICIFPVALISGVSVPFLLIGVSVYFVFSRLHLFSEKDKFLFHLHSIVWCSLPIKNVSTCMLGRLFHLAPTGKMLFFTIFKESENQFIVLWFYMYVCVCVYV